ncbi:MAG: winged helix-turn-helix domain-containing protein [Nanoarchaeota archaeon]
MEDYNLWDLEGVHVKVKDCFLKKINNKIFSKFKVKRDFYNQYFKESNLPFYVFKNMLKSFYCSKFYVPLEFLLNVCDYLDLSKEELQKNVISYKSQGSVNFIDKPIFPIIINPVFDMIYAHNIGDGTVSIAKNRAPYFAYRQFNRFYREAYLKKIDFVFGNVIHKQINFKDITRVRCPSVLSSLFFKYYELDDRGFLSETARISSRIFEKGFESMVAVLCAFIIDEGYIDSTQISIVLKNHLLVEDLKKICDRLEYGASIVHKQGDYKDYSGVSILRNGMKRFYEDYVKVNKKYSLIDLGVKGERIRNSFNIINRQIIRVKGNQDLIISLLKNERLSVNQLANRINMTRQGVRYHIHNLLNDGKIRIIDKAQLNWIYGV